MTKATLALFNRRRITQPGLDRLHLSQIQTGDRRTLISMTMMMHSNYNIAAINSLESILLPIEQLLTIMVETIATTAILEKWHKYQNCHRHHQHRCCNNLIEVPSVATSTNITIAIPPHPAPEHSHHPPHQQQQHHGQSPTKSTSRKINYP